MDLLDKEEEYQRLNQELEAQTNQLVKEAEAIISKQENFLLNSQQANDWEKIISKSTSSYENEVPQPSSRPVTHTGTRKVSNPKPSSARRPKSSGAKQKKKDGPMAMHSLTSAITRIEQNLERESIDMEIPEDVMPEPANEMGSEAQIRFLKAKLRVLQEEYNKVTSDYNSENEKQRKMQVNLKALETENERIKKVNKLQKSQIEKNNGLLDEEKKRLVKTQSQLNTALKELDATDNELKKANTTYRATDVRLNRALEDVEKYKSQLAKEKNAGKENLHQDKLEIDHLRSENKRLERLQTEMTTIFKKQQKLINVLKRQVLHIEAAKLLSFTEQEFLKVLDWGSQ